MFPLSDDKKVNWYVLFARTGAEERLVEQLKYEFSEDSYLPFIPKKIAAYRRKGIKSNFQQICFPGYVFLESDKLAEDVINDFKNRPVQQLKDMLKCNKVKKNECI